MIQEKKVNIQHLFSIASSTVADPSTVTVRIESASTSDLNVQDVVTTSSSDEDDRQEQPQQSNTERFSYRISSSTSRRNTSAIGTMNGSGQLQRPSRLTKDKTNSMQIPQNRPITAVSLPAKSTTFDNEWNIGANRSLASSIQRRNPSCPLISATNLHAKASCQSVFSHQPAPDVFTTTSECLGIKMISQLIDS